MFAVFAVGAVCGGGRRMLVNESKFKCQAQLQLLDIMYTGIFAGLRHGGPGGWGRFDVRASLM